MSSYDRTFDNAQAIVEGWDVFDVDSTGYLEIERDDEQGHFTSDAEALLHVVERARAGSAYHRAALSQCGIVVAGEPEERPRA
jgi:hypothetical protein